MKVKFNGHKNRVKHPKTGKTIEAGDTFECDDGWLRRHQAYINNGALEEVKAAPRKRKPKASK